MKKSIVPGLLLVLLLLVMAGGCTNPIGSAKDAAGSATARRVTSRETDAFGVVHEKGVLGPGALYEIWVPPYWQLGHRGLMMYAHGYANPSQPVALPSIPEDLQALLLSKGYAIAYSSYSQNGWAVKDGAIRMRQLRGYFAGAYGEPSKALLVGASEGALISIMLAERNPELFGGALLIGGPIGGASMEVDYIYNLRILFDYFFRTPRESDELAFIASQTSGPLVDLAPVASDLAEALGDGALDAHPIDSLYLSPDGATFAANVTPLIMALFSVNPLEPNEASALAAMTVDGKPLFNWLPSSPEEQALQLALTLATGLWYNIYGTEDMLGRTHGHVPVDNTGSVYVSMLDPSAPLLISGVERLNSSPDALNYLEHWYQPTGRLSIPVFVLHTSLDPIVPVSHAYAYQQLAAAQGSSAFLTVVPPLPFFGHCQILIYTELPTGPTFVPDDVLFAYYLSNTFNALLEQAGMPPIE
jgi:pimeloyl-ACP methyl ester carboxylesterase